MEYNQLFQLACHVQHYPWGARCRNDRKPFIAELENMPAEDDQPFAELWIGAHPKLPAEVITDGANVPLDRFIDDAPQQILGDKILRKGFHRLPFLLKVLDCETSLSIQAHPDKRGAERLNKADTEHYPDANHKPEIAVSIKGMDAFCEFRPIPEIVADLHRLTTLASIFHHLLAEHETIEKTPRDWLRQAYSLVFDMPQDQVSYEVARLVDEIRSLAHPTPQDLWVLKLMEQHPEDRGIFSAYFLNVVHLDPGQAVFLGPNEPHAYLQGTIVECMASSDNVVRAGLTPKFIDRRALVEMLTYDDGAPEILEGEPLGEGERVYRVPVPEFQVEFYEHGSGVLKEYQSDGAVSLVLVLEGEAEFRLDGRTIAAPGGSAWLWPAACPSVACRFRQSRTVIVRARPNMT